MSIKKTGPRQTQRLKERVEAFLNNSMSAIKKTPPAEIRNLFDDMLIYQSELEKHNNELRKESERGASEREIFYRRLAENVTDLICVINIDGFGFDYVSPSVAAMSGYTINEITALNVNDVLLPDSITKILAVLDREIEKEKQGVAEPQRLELEGIKKDGTIVWVEASVRFLRDNSGQVTDILCVARDISMRKEAEKKYRDSEAKFRAIFNNTYQFIGLLDVDGKLLAANNASLEFGNLAESDVLGRYFWEAPWWSHDTKQREVLQNAITRAAKGEVVHFEAYHPGIDGTIHFVDGTIKPVKNDDDEVVYLLPEGKDITKRKLAEETVKKANERLEEKVKDRTKELEEKNIALKILLDQRGEDQKNLEETMLSNVKELLLPGLSRLSDGMSETKHKTALRILEANLNEIIAPFADSGSAIYMKLTPMEVQVANYIKHGASTKEIAESLCLSRRTVDTHRYNIRKKIGISGKGVNLRTYLSTRA